MMKNILIGAIIGIANIIPGVSGGTMAVVLRVYNKLIFSISNIRKDFVNSMKFLIPIGIGGVFGILAFTKVIEYTLTNYSTATNLIFIGLVLGSIPMILSNIKGNRSIWNLIILFSSIIIIVLMDVIVPSDTVNIIDTLSFKTTLFIFIGAIISASTMIIPGISGSFIMLVIGLYSSITTAISNFNIPVLMVFGAGAVVGILLCSKLIEFLFMKYKSQTYSGILGLMIGSVYLLFPTVGFNIETLVGVILAIGFGVLSNKMS